MDPRLVRPAWRGRTNVDRLTISCIERAESWAGHEFYVTQGSYQSGAGDPLSGSTHDGGGVVDLRWCGHLTCIEHLRRAGMAAWLRTPAQGPWPYHVHAVVIGHPLLAASAARQVVAYLNGRNGLASNGPDDGPRLDPIPRPVWPWPQEDDMPTAAEVVDELLSRRIKVRRGGKGDAVALPVEQVLRETFQRAERVDVDKIAATVAANLSGGLSSGDLSAEAVKAAVKDALREGVGD